MSQKLTSVLPRYSYERSAKMNYKEIIFPIQCWGNEYVSVKALYNNAPFTSRVHISTFARRLIVCNTNCGNLPQFRVQAAFHCQPHAFEAGGAVYELVHNATGRKYIGITDDPIRRKKTHFACHKSSKLVISRAIQEFGAQAFSFNVIEQGDFSRADLRRKELKIIEEQKTMSPYGFNVTKRHPTQ